MALDDWAQVNQDQHNANLGTEIGAQVLEQSIERNKGGRGIVLAANNDILGGNKTAAEAEKQGLGLRIIDSDGQEIIAVRRTDIPSAEDPKGRQLAIDDNRSGELNLEWDPKMLASAQQVGVDLDNLWPDDYLQALLPPLPSESDLFSDNGDPIGDVRPVNVEMTEAGALAPEGKTRDERSYRFEFTLEFDDSLIVKMALDEAALSGETPEEWFVQLATLYVAGDAEALLAGSRGQKEASGA